jgi:hypothetical protein
MFGKPKGRKSSEKSNGLKMRLPRPAGKISYG